MNKLIWHIVKKAFRRFRLALGIWWLLILIKLFLHTEEYARNLAAGDSTGVQGATAAYLWGRIPEPVLVTGPVFLWLADFCLTFFLVTNVIQEDTPIGDRAFWRTRPMSGASLFVAKALFIGLAIYAMPVAMEFVSAQAMGVGQPDVLGALRFLVALQVGWVAVPLLFAVLWRRLLLGVLSVFLLAAIPSILTALLNALAPNQELAFGWTAITLPILYSLLLATSLATAVWMYIFRGRLGAFMIFGFSVTLAYLLGLNWAPQSPSACLSASIPICSPSDRWPPSAPASLGRDGHARTTPPYSTNPAHECSNFSL